MSRNPPKTRILQLTRLRVLLMLVLAVTITGASVWHFTAAVPSPNTSSTCEPGNCTQIPCKVDVYKSGTQAVDKDGLTGVGYVASGTDLSVLQDAVNNRLDSPRTFQQRVCVTGSYTFTNNMTIPSNVYLDLTNAKITLGNNVGKDILDSGNYPASGNCDNVTIAGGTLDGNKANGNSANGSDVFYGCNHLLIDGTTVLNTGGSGFLMRRSTDVVVRNTHIFGTTTDAITCYDGSQFCLITGNYISGVAAGANGILLLGTENVGQLASNGLSAINNNIVQSTAGQGIAARSGADNSTIADNIISCATALCTSGSTSTGIYLFSQLSQAVTTRLHVHGNTIRLGTGSTSVGITVNDDGGTSFNKQVDIMDNLIEAHTGISVQGQSSKIDVEWNDVRNTVTPFTAGASVTLVFVGYNSGYVTINSGANTVADGNTVNHGLASVTPTIIICTTSVANQVCAITASGTVNFTVAIKVDSTGAAGSSQTIYWYAQYCPTTQFTCSA